MDSSLQTQLSNQVQALQAEMCAFKAEVTKSLERIEAGIQANICYNAFARVENSTAKQGHLRLVCLKDVWMNQPIPDFPATVPDTSTMKVADVSRILRALGLPDMRDTCENDQEKRQRMRHAIGVTVIALEDLLVGVSGDEDEEPDEEK